MNDTRLKSVPRMDRCDIAEEQEFIQRVHGCQVDMSVSCFCPCFLFSYHLGEKSLHPCALESGSLIAAQLLTVWEHKSHVHVSPFFLDCFSPFSFHFPSLRSSPTCVPIFPCIPRGHCNRRGFPALQRCTNGSGVKTLWVLV